MEYFKDQSLSVIVEGRYEGKSVAVGQELEDDHESSSLFIGEEIVDFRVDDRVDIFIVFASSIIRFHHSL